MPAPKVIRAGPRPRSRHRRAGALDRRGAPGASPSSAASPAAAAASHASAGRGARKATWCASSAQSGGPPARGASARLCFSRPRTCAGQPRIFHCFHCFKCLPGCLPLGGARTRPAARPRPAPRARKRAPALPHSNEQGRASACTGLSPLWLGSMRVTAWRGGCSRARHGAAAAAARAMQCCTGGARPRRTRPSRLSPTPYALRPTPASHQALQAGRVAARRGRYGRGEHEREHRRAARGRGGAAAPLVGAASRPGPQRLPRRLLGRAPWYQPPLRMHASDGGVVHPGTDPPPTLCRLLGMYGLNWK